MAASFAGEFGHLLAQIVAGGFRGGITSGDQVEDRGRVHAGSRQDGVLVSVNLRTRLAAEAHRVRDTDDSGGRSCGRYAPPLS